MAEFKEVPVVEVHKDNFAELWPSMILAIKSATFVAIDTELSGLGTKKLLFAKSVDDRYNEMSHVAKTRSIISLGISCFVLQLSDESENLSECQEKTQSLSFQVQIFNILLLCSENYIVEPVTLKFLIEHGFDFNKQYARGISYYKGNDKDGDNEYQCMRQLFMELLLSKVPVVLHNPLFDLMFMYQNFYANLPSSIQTFVADVNEMFAGGVYDTKYIAEFKARMPASYLEYVFRRCQRENYTSMNSGGRHILTNFLTYPRGMIETIVYLPCALEEQKDENHSTVCIGYAAFGWCSLGNNCKNSHDIDLILDNEDNILSKKRMKRKKKQNKSDKKLKLEGHLSDEQEIDLESQKVETGNDVSVELAGIKQQTENQDVQINDTKEKVDSKDRSSAGKCSNSSRKSSGHRAGFDSFMTGFAFTTFLWKYGKFDSRKGSTIFKDAIVQELNNKITLSGKDIPLLIQKGNFAKNSKDHKYKMEKYFSSTGNS